MTLTRSKTGVTPKKPEHPDYVETPRARRPRKSIATTESPHEAKTPANGHANGSVGAVKASSPKTPGSKPRGRPKKNKVENESDDSEGYEFGGPWGVSAIMIGFPLLMWYMWIGATYYDGKFPVPAANQSYADFAKHLLHLAYTGAFPTLKAWAIYWTFFVFEMICYLYVPGVYSKGKPLEHLGGKQLDYYCSGQLSLWVTIAVAGALHYTGLFKLYTLIDEFGPIMSVAILSGIIVSVIAYISAFARGATHRMSGNHIYDFFMGAELNPRMFTWLDFKMFFEVRLPWYILFLCSLGACARQYEQYGYVSGELYFLLMAHFLYANACGKGEELIPPTWDMYYEKWGFMLIFWNMAGVPLSYCHCIIYLSNHSPDTYRWNRGFLTFLYISYLFAYWIWDTCGSQKNYFRSQQNGTATDRVGFPTLPFRHVENPRTIPVPGGKDLLADGWYKYARKIHYTCDTWFAICWALVTGFSSPFPWFYPVFFVIMITHRAQRDIQKCRERYGEAWKEFERRTPYLFIPYVI